MSTQKQIAVKCFVYGYETVQRYLSEYDSRFIGAKICFDGMVFLLVGWVYCVAAESELEKFPKWFDEKINKLE